MVAFGVQGAVGAGAGSGGVISHAGEECDEQGGGEAGGEEEEEETTGRRGSGPWEGDDLGDGGG